MAKILGYGEDALTLWALNNRISEILSQLEDSSDPLDCIAFYRPSFGRGGRSKAIFGEFDSILASSEYIYLLESKWDRNMMDMADKYRPDDEFKKQVTRHKIFSWYYMNWDPEIYVDWRKFSDSRNLDFRACFPDKEIASPGSGLAQNLESILNILQKHCGGPICKSKKLRDVLLYFYNGKQSTAKEAVEGVEHFQVVNIDYSDHSRHILGNFFRL